jgi:hypothetical protein
MRLLVMLFMLVTFLPVVFCTSVIAESASESQLDKTFKRTLELYNKGMHHFSLYWRCMPSTHFACDDSHCKNSKPTIWIELDFSTKQYRRCDQKGCDSYTMKWSTGGIYTNIFLDHMGTIFKASNDGSDFVDVAIHGTTIYNYFGKCLKLTLQPE